MKLYSYDHCPFCVKARMILGYKGVDFDLITLLNDDEDTPIAMIGAKMLPILMLDDGTYMPESLDIVAHVNAMDGGISLSNGPMTPELDAWLADSGAYLHPLTMPRWGQADLEEFATQSAINYFTKKKEAWIGPFDAHLQQSAAYITTAENALQQLDGLLSKNSDFYLPDNTASINDIHLFPVLRALTVVKNLTFPPKVTAYLQAQKRLTNIPLYHGQAV